MFTAEITKIVKNVKSFTVTIVYKKDGLLIDTEVVQNITPFSSVYSHAKNNIDLYTEIDSFDPTSFLGVIDFNNIPQTGKSQAEKDREVFFANYSEYQKKLKNVDEGLLAATDTSISDLVAVLKATNKPEYGVF